MLKFQNNLAECSKMIDDMGAISNIIITMDENGNYRSSFVQEQPKEEPKAKPAPQQEPPSDYQPKKDAPQQQQSTKPKSAPQPKEEQKKAEPYTKPKEPKTESKKQPAAEAGFGVNGFDISNFVKPKQAPPAKVDAGQLLMNSIMSKVAEVQAQQQQPPVATQQPPNSLPKQQPHIGQTIMPQHQPDAEWPPAGYDEASPLLKCEMIHSYIKAMSGAVPDIFDPMPGIDPKQKLSRLRKNISFIKVDGRKRQMDEIQLRGLIAFVESPLLKQRLKEYNSVDRPNNPHLTEVNIGDLRKEDAEFAIQNGFDMAFTFKLKDKQYKGVVLFKSVPEYNPGIRAWTYGNSIFKTKA